MGKAGIYKRTAKAERSSRIFQDNCCGECKPRQQITTFNCAFFPGI